VTVTFLHDCFQHWVALAPVCAALRCCIPAFPSQ
jgi:hypothetical protein